MKKHFLLAVLVLPLLSGCSPTRSVPDTSKLYIGGYPTATSENGAVYDCHLYVCFIKPEEAGQKADADVSWNLNGGDGLAEFGRKSNGTPEFADVGAAFLKTHRGYGNISEWFVRGNLVEFWTGIGDDMSFVSARSYATSAGRIVSVSTISEAGERLDVMEGSYYREKFEWRFWLWD